jgi:hypothetical protein
VNSEQQETFGIQILAIGDGSNTINDTIPWPTESIVADNSIELLAEIVFRSFYPKRPLHHQRI